MSLEDLARREGTDKADHGYMPHYERHLLGMNNVHLLEIGVETGASLRLWQACFFGAGTRIMGVDITHRELPGLEVHVGDATKPETYEGWLPQQLDVIIDDGSHQARDVLTAFDILWPKLSVDGWYVIEDLATCWDRTWAGDPKTGGEVMYLIRALVGNAIRGGDIAEFHAYKDIVFLRKG